MVAATPLRAAVLACVSCVALGHSWIACTDVQGIQNKQQAPKGKAETDPARLVYSDANCKGYSRNYSAYYDKTFGLDRGNNYQPSPGGAMCQSMDQRAYTPEFPKASYKANGQVCIQHPSKNHVAAATTNQFIPDTRIAVYRSKAPGQNPQSTKEMDLLNHYNGVHTNGVIDYKGYQNCPGFDSNNDKAVCTLCFDVGNVPAGEYTFVWSWEFNAGTPAYTSCWEATVGTGGPSTPTTAQPPAPAPAAVQAPLPMPQPAPANPVPVPATAAGTDATCANGIYNTDTGVCCPKSCGECGGTGCGSRIGGPAACCSSGIVAANKSCKSTTAPCRVWGAPEPTATCSSKYQQCGGKNWAGATCCASGASCKVINEWYYQCL